METEEDRDFQKLESGVIEKIESKKRFKAISLSELFSIEFPENRWIIEGLIPREGITILSGAPASYKTWLLLKMAIDIAQGNKFLGEFPCEKSNILIIDEENHLRLIRERITMMGAPENLSIHLLSQKGFLVSDQNLIDQVLGICEEYQIDIIFIDSLVRINNAEENDASQMSEVFRCIRQLCQKGKTVIITHHERKEGVIKLSAQNRLRGSSDISAAVDAHIAVKRDRHDRNKITIEQAKLRIDRELDPFEVVMKKSEDKTEFCYLGTQPEESSKKDLAKDCILSILTEEESGLSNIAICKRVKELGGIGEKNTRDAIKELLQDKVISEKPGVKHTKIYELSENQVGNPDV